MKYLMKNLEDQWRTGKTLIKLSLIDNSKIFDRPRHDRAKAFVKFEVGEKIPKKARLIQGNLNEATAYEYPDEYSAVAGVLKDLMDHEFCSGGVTFRFTYAGGLNHDQLSDSFSNAIYNAANFYLDERDGANWDSTMSTDLLKHEHDVYVLLKLQSAKAFARRMMDVKGYVRTKCALEKIYVWYLTHGKRLSGDWDTSTGNTMLSMMIIFTVILELPSNLRPWRVTGWFMGDDYLGLYEFKGVLPCPKDLAKALNHFESKTGITPERGIFQDPLSVQFISLTPWPRIDGGYQFVPKIARQLRKLFWAPKFVHHKQILNYRSGIAISFWFTYHGFELMMKFIKLHFDPSIKPIEYEAYYSDMLTKKSRNVNWTLGFVHKYGLPMSSTKFDWPATKGAAVLEHPLIEEMLRQELLDPCDRPRCLS